MNEDRRICPHCGAIVPVVAMTTGAWKAVAAALVNGSRTLAAAEISSLGLVGPAASKRFVDHVLFCVFSWPFDVEQSAVLCAIDQVFAGIARPEHFTDFTHCDECAEHDRTLRNRTVTTIRRDDLGNQGCDPINFTNEQGWAYYFPALARFAMMPAIWPARDAYVVLLASDLSWDGPDNRRLRFCTRDQRIGVAGLIGWIAENEHKLVCLPFDAQDFYHPRWQSWRDGVEVWKNSTILAGKG